MKRENKKGWRKIQQQGTRRAKVKVAILLFLPHVRKHYQTSTMEQWTLSTNINKSKKSKVKNHPTDPPRVFGALTQTSIVSVTSMDV